MAATLFLLRHAAHARVGSTLCGRMPGVSLGEEGRRQARALAERLAPEAVDAVYASPIERARETAAPIAARLGLSTETEDGLAEIDFGDWTGRDFADLDGDPAWDRWNAARASARPPGGESMAEAQARALAGVERLRARHPDGRVAAVSHCDVIKAVLAAVLGVTLDGIHRFEILPASISALALWPGGGKVLSMNETLRA
ncbi:histidine phosphatase family protein [Roseomonas nepalensis]|uniref:Histidine phosphatase family protein n=1 Tax=Muricoccus nepalensis TaxID=1854500 RepID=A0A502FVB6_9PROT|nr:histidine phosphatase family protein [Roseomonas nepalensis]TPG53371.1 histidine phosphatase family protein [Roseomonas nepalensis]